MLQPELIQGALESAPDAIVISDQSGSVVFANRQVTALFGYEPEEILGGSIEQLLPQRFRARHAAHRCDFAANPRVRPMGAGLELYGQRKDGSEFPVEISLSPIGRTDLTTAAIRDVTERKRIERELVAAREEANHANLAKSRFLSTASHDLRQPLQTLALLNGALRRVISDAYASAAISQQEQAINAMSRLLGALLDISKLESGAIRPDITDFTVDVLFEEMRREFDSIAASKGLMLEVQADPLAVHSDRSLVEQVLRNLVSNAIKYTHKGWVRLRGLNQGALVRVEVLDTGVGIPADQIPHICDEFYQVGVPANGSRDGYGLGLSIVKRIVKLLDLQLEMHSEVGKGSTFALTIPASAGHLASGSSKSVSSINARTPGRRPRVLLVEDDPGVRDATRLLLRAEGYEVTAVTSLTESLAAACAADFPEVVVADYHLGPGETGLQVVEALRAHLGIALKAVLVTGDTSSAIHELPRRPYMRVVSKPVQADELLGLLRELSVS